MPGCTEANQSNTRAVTEPMVVVHVSLNIIGEKTLKSNNNCTINAKLNSMYGKKNKLNTGKNCCKQTWLDSKYNTHTQGSLSDHSESQAVILQVFCVG